MHSYIQTPVHMYIYVVDSHPSVTRCQMNTKIKKHYLIFAHLTKKARNLVTLQIIMSSDLNIGLDNGHLNNT